MELASECERAWPVVCLDEAVPRAEHRAHQLPQARLVVADEDRHTVASGCRLCLVGVHVSSRGLDSAAAQGAGAGGGETPPCKCRDIRDHADARRAPASPAGGLRRLGRKLV